MRISDWSADVCSSAHYADLVTPDPAPAGLTATINGSVLGLENSTGLPYDPANVVAFIDSRTRNVARQRFSGLDLSIRYRITIGGDRELSLSATGTFLKSRQQLISGAPWPRSEERRVGQECVRRCRSRWLPYHKKK